MPLLSRLRLQLLRLPRQGRGAERLQAVGVRLRPGGRLRRPGEGGPRPARASRPRPEHSLLLRKASGRRPHGGGVRIPPRPRDYETLRDWIAAGVPFGEPTTPQVVRIRVEPAERVLDLRRPASSCSVIAHATATAARSTSPRHARFQSNNEALAAVDAGGLVTPATCPARRRSWPASWARWTCSASSCRGPRRSRTTRRCRENNFIDALVDAQAAQAEHRCRPTCATTPTFLRRVYLDVIGTLPTRRRGPAVPGRPAAGQAGAAGGRAAGAAGVRRLLGAEVGRPAARRPRRRSGHKRAYAYYRWIRDSLSPRTCRSTSFARELVTAEGPLAEVGPAELLQGGRRKPGEAASTLSQVFLGVRIACAECHHHPFDRWSQADYYGMAAFFTPVGVRKSAARRGAGRRGRPADASTRAPARPILATPLGATMPAASPTGDRRAALADWMTAPDNPFFARNLANRAVGALPRPRPGRAGGRRARHQPADATPSCSTPWRSTLVENKYDVKQLIRAITRVAGLPAVVDAERDERAATSRTTRGRCFKRPDAEVLLDMVVPGDGRAGEVRRRAAGHAGDPAVGQQGAALLPEAVRPAGAGQRLRVRARTPSRASPRCCTCSTATSCRTACGTTPAPPPACAGPRRTTAGLSRNCG